MEIATNFGKEILLLPTATFQFVTQTLGASAAILGLIEGVAEHGLGREGDPGGGRPTVSGGDR